MRKKGILNPDICNAISALGHTEYMMIADPGLPIPEHLPVIDISLVNGIPGFREVLDAVAEELVIESYIYAAEMENQSCELFRYLKDKLQDIPGEFLPHEDFKAKIAEVRMVIRTGECTPYANVMLKGGVIF